MTQTRFHNAFFPQPQQKVLKFNPLQFPPATSTVTNGPHVGQKKYLETGNVGSKSSDSQDLATGVAAAERGVAGVSARPGGNIFLNGGQDTSAPQFRFTLGASEVRIGSRLSKGDCALEQSPDGKSVRRSTINSSASSATNPAEKTACYQNGFIRPGAALSDVRKVSTDGYGRIGIATPMFPKVASSHTFGGIRNPPSDMHTREPANGTVEFSGDTQQVAFCHRFGYERALVQESKIGSEYSGYSARSLQHLNQVPHSSPHFGQQLKNFPFQMPGRHTADHNKFGHTRMDGYCSASHKALSEYSGSSDKCERSEKALSLSLPRNETNNVQSEEDQYLLPEGINSGIMQFMSHYEHNPEMFCASNSILQENGHGCKLNCFKMIDILVFVFS